MRRTFNGNKTLDTLQQDCIDIQEVKKANLTNVQGQNALMPTETKITVNICEFELKDDIGEVHDDLKFVKKADVNVAFLAQMAAESRIQIGGDMDIFVEDTAVNICIFGKIT